MKNPKKLYFIMLIIFLIPAFLFLLKPELDLQGKYIKFSWGESIQNIRTAIKKKNPKEITDKVYGDFDVMFKNTVLNQKVDYIYVTYQSYSKTKIRKFMVKVRNFIS